MKNQKIFDFLEFFKAINDTQADFVFSNFKVRHSSSRREEHWHSDEKSFLTMLAHCKRVDLSWMSFEIILGEYEKDEIDVDFLVPI